MEGTDACAINRAVRDALRDAAAVIEARGVRVEATFGCRKRVVNEEVALYQAVYTLVRGIPPRLAEGTVLQVATRDMAGGDVELTWRGVERSGTQEEDDPERVLREGPHGDLFAVALAGLRALCRARGGVMEERSDWLPEGGLVERRYLFLIPALVHDESWHPRRHE